MDCNNIHRGVGVYQRVWLMYQHNQVSNAIVAEITGDRKVFDIRIDRCRLLNKSQHQSELGKCDEFRNSNSNGNQFGWKFQRILVGMANGRRSSFQLSIDKIVIKDNAIHEGS